MRNIAVNGSVISLIAAAIIGVAAMVHGAGKFELNWFYPWVLAPYILLLPLFCLPRRQSDARVLAGCIAAVIVLLFTSWFYIGAMWFSAASTSALIFIFAPGCLLAGGLVVWGIAWFALAWMTGAS